MKIIACLGAWLLASAAFGCANLPDLERGTCGNQVVERGEDCDSFPAGQCVPAGSANECRLSCETAADCRSGWGCGADGICRQASGRYELASRPPGDTALHLAFADFDGDARDDLLVAEPSRFALHYHDANASLVDTLAVSTLPSLPALGDLSADGLADFTLARGMVGVSRGRPDRTLAPASYAPFVVPHQNIRFVALDAVPESVGGQTGQDEVLMISGEGIMSPMDDASLFPIPFDATRVIGDIPAGDLNEGLIVSPCDEFVLAMQGEDRVNVYTPCAFNSADGVAGWNEGSDSLPGVQLPPGVTVADSALLADVNRDSHLDIMVGGSDSMLYVAFGVGDGTFHSDPLNVPLATGDGLMNVEPLLALGEFPLAAGFINQDDRIDFVMRDRILMSSSAAFGSCGDSYDCIFALGASWTTARIADLNGNGAADVICGSSSAFKVDFFNNTGTGLLNHFQISTDGPAAEFTIGDYDGDLLLDVAFTELGSGTASDSLSVMFGRGFGAPEPPVSVGRIGKIQQIVAGDVSDDVDGIKDLVVLSTADAAGANAKVGMFLGSSDRQIQSPFILLADRASVFPALRGMVGQFDGDAAGHLDLALATTTDLDQGGPIETNLWVLPSTGDATLDVTTARKSNNLPDEFHPCLGLQAVVDLDRDGIDEIVQFSPVFAGDVTRGAVATARTQPGPAGFRSWVFDTDVLSVDEFFFDNPLPGDACVLGPGTGVGGKPQPGQSGGSDGAGATEPGYGPTYAVPTRIEVADVDGDGAREVAVMGYVQDDFALGGTVVVIFPNPGSGRLDVENRIVVAVPDDFVLSFTFINADADREQELVVLTPNRAYLVDVDMARHSASVRHPLPGLFGGLAAASGDIDGDGIEDLAISGLEGLAVFRGVSVLP